MQLLSTTAAYYIKSVRSILKICRRTANVSVVKHDELAALDDWHILTNVEGYIGKITIDEYNYFLVILNAEQVGELGPTDEPVYRIAKALAVPIIDDGIERPTYFDSLTNGGFDKIKDKQKKLVNFVTSRLVPSIRLIDDVVKLINDLQTFYFCKTLDLTLSTQRRALDPTNSVDEFFWNRNLLNDLYNVDDTPRENTGEWILRIIHGYFDQRQLSCENKSQLRLTLISRRSVRRAGVRYLRRGIDSDGHVANFVETEMIIRFFEHSLSFVQIRGSIPIYWSQRGFRYRPPPIVDKQMIESLPACRDHFRHLHEEYGSPLVVVNLVDQAGREAALGEAFKQHIPELGMNDVRYFPFDYHAICKGRRDKISLLLDPLSTDLQRINFTWIDKQGQIIIKQTGVVRTNCVDCLDRTNLIQSAISQTIVATQALKLGIIEPFVETPDVLLQCIKSMWSAHGDCLSRQYAGTSALKKGEGTRHGRLFGLMKDGVNSAKRYTNAHIRDYHRQLAIDVLVSGRGSTLKAEEQEAEIAAEAQSTAADSGGESASDESCEEEDREIDITAPKPNEKTL